MGYFKDAFDVGAGATLGNMAVNTGAQIGATFVDAKFKQAYNNYRAQYFDPVIRNDLNELLVFERLPQRAYPFPNSNNPVKKENFFKRHKKFTILLLVTIIVDILGAFLNMFASTSALALNLHYNIIAIVGILSWAVCISGLVMSVKKVGRGGKKVLSGGYKTQLENDGQQYWYVREYVRQALASGELDFKNAMTKIVNTSLAQQLPDTVDKIEANAFYYRQKHGMV